MHEVPKIIPAILSDSLPKFRQRLKLVAQFAKRIQIDVVDSKFAPFSGIICRSSVEKFAPSHFLEAHLMIENPQKQIEKYKTLGFKKVIPHFSALKDPQKYLSKKGVSIALNPDEPAEILKPYLANLKTILIMGVIPGQMGQSFIPKTLDKIRQFRQFSDKIEIEVDGGVNSSNISQIVQAGADVLVCGSAIFGQGKPKRNFEILRRKIGSRD